MKLYKARFLEKIESIDNEECEKHDVGGVIYHHNKMCNKLNGKFYLDVNGYVQSFANYLLSINTKKLFVAQ